MCEEYKRVIRITVGRISHSVIRRFGCAMAHAGWRYAYPAYGLIVTVQTLTAKT